MKRNICILMSLLALSACDNSIGSNPNNTTGQNSQKPILAEVKSPKINFNPMSSYHESNTSNSNEAGSLPIGWNSKINMPARQNCWIYTQSPAGGAQTDAGGGVLHTANDAYNSLGVNASVQLQFGAFSANSSLDFSSFSKSSRQSVNAYALASGYGNVAFEITGVQPWAYEYYKKSPEEFVQQCGDKVITRLPVKNQISVALNYVSGSSETNQSINAKLSGSYGLDSFSADIKTQSSQGKRLLNQHKTTDIYYYYGIV